jgi:hypothetical protein
MSTDTQPEYGVVFENADITDIATEADLVRNMSDSLERSTSISIDAKSRGLRTAIAIREPEGDWLTMYGRQKPSEWIVGIRRSA